MKRMYTPPPPKNIFMGLFLCFFAAVIIVSPLPILYRSMLTLFTAYLAASYGGMPFAYIVVVLVPPLGLLKQDDSWLIFLPMIISSGLLAMLGLEYSWRYAALLISPFLYILPQLFVWKVSEHRLFEIAIPWQPSATRWLIIHAFVAGAGVLTMLFLDRKRQKSFKRLETTTRAKRKPSFN